MSWFNIKTGAGVNIVIRFDEDFYWQSGFENKIYTLFHILSTPLECQFGATSLNIGCQCRQVSVRPDSGAPCLHRVKHKLTSAWHRHISGIPRSQSRWRIENSLFAFLSQTGNVVFENGKRHSFMAFVVNQNQGLPGFTKLFATEMVAWLVIRLGSKLILSFSKVLLTFRTTFL